MEIIFPGGKRVDASYRGFTIKTDQPLPGGGDNSAPAPFDLFLASIGTCTGIYVLSFCQQRGIPTENIRIRQNLEIDQATHMIGTIFLKIELPPDFPEKYRDALIRSAEQCSVKKHLERPPKFEVITEMLPS